MSAVPVAVAQPSQRDRARRTAILCGRCLQFIAFYRAGWRPRRSKIRVQRKFWIAANGAFFDSAILEWCKLFADPKGKQYWSRCITDKASFIATLYGRVGLSETEFLAYIDTFKHPRDKFIAHLDEEPTMDMPWLRPARASVALLRDHLLSQPPTAHWFMPHEKVPSARMYRDLYKLAVYEYRQAAVEKI